MAKACIFAQKKMQQNIGQISLLVRDYDEAIEFYTQKLHFELEEDTVLSETKRWVVVRPKGSGCALLLAKASGEAQAKAIGNQTGGRVFLFLYTDNLQADFENLLAQNIEVVRQPSEEDFGFVLIFKDLYGNLWDLIQLKK